MPPIETIEDKKPEDNVQDPHVAPLMKLLLEDVADDPESQKKPEEKKPEEAKPEDKKPEEKKPEDKKPDDHPIRVRKPKAAERPALPIEERRIEDKKPEDKKPEVQAPDDSDLEENEREMISDAAFAEKHLGEKYKGLETKTRKFVRDQIKYIADHGGEENFDPQSQEYRQWLEANNPKLTRVQMREINDARILQKADELSSSRVNDVNYERFVEREEPAVKAEASRVYQDLAKSVVPKEIQEVITKLGYKAAQEQYSVELDTVHNVLSAVSDDIAEFERITRVDPKSGRAMAAIADDPKHPKFAQHSRLQRIVQETCESFNKNGGADRQRADGRWFVTRDEYAKILKSRPDLIGNYWTFSNKEIMRRALLAVPAVVANSIRKNVESIEKRGFVRKPVVAPELKKPDEKKPEERSSAPPAPHQKPVQGADGSSKPGEYAGLLAKLKEE